VQRTQVSILINKRLRTQSRSFRPLPSRWPATAASYDSLLVEGPWSPRTFGRELVAAALEHYGAGVLTAASAAEALDLLQTQPVNVLLADIAMPDEDGYSLIRRLRALPSPRRAGIPAAALTSFARDEDRQHTIRLEPRRRDSGFNMNVRGIQQRNTGRSAVCQDEG
jgi:CheY-like chemotaxis protein